MLISCGPRQTAVPERTVQPCERRPLHAASPSRALYRHAGQAAFPDKQYAGNLASVTGGELLLLGEHSFLWLWVSRKGWAVHCRSLFTTEMALYRAQIKRTLSSIPITGSDLPIPRPVGGVTCFLLTRLPPCAFAVLGGWSAGWA